jgi:vanillate O-demethylase monooxygenase subunit
MYPFQHPQPFIRQQWYAAAWSHEITRTPFERTLLDEPVLMYRTESGRVAALRGLCPHRMLPLSRGILNGDEIVCAYHGFAFNPEGRCTRIPTQATPPENYRARTFPLIERGGLVWLWMGDAGRAAETALPDIESIGIGHTSWCGTGQSLMPLRARWSLLLDNLFDLSHIGWVHARSIGQSDIVMVRPTIEDDPTRYNVKRSLLDCPVDPFHRWLHPLAPERMHLDLYTEMLSPCIINAGSRAVAADTNRLLGNLNFIHIVTPESAHSTHYFGVVTRDFRIDDDTLSHALTAQDARVRAEDRETLEAIEPFADRYGDTKHELSALVDGGAIRLRRRLEAMLGAEAT